jgi:hypothetical protein
MRTHKLGLITNSAGFSNVFIFGVNGIFKNDLTYDKNVYLIRLFIQFIEHKIMIENEGWGSISDQTLH